CPDRWSSVPPVGTRSFPVTPVGGAPTVRLVAPASAPLEAYEEVAAALRADGYHVASPHELSPDLSFRELLEWLTSSIYDSDIVALLPGWQSSPRAVAAVVFAEALGKEVVPAGAVLDVA